MPVFTSLCSLAASMMWPAASGSCSHAFPTMVDSTLKLDQNEPLLPNTVLTRYSVTITNGRWHMPIIPALLRLIPGDHEIKVSLDYKLSSYISNLWPTTARSKQVNAHAAMSVVTWSLNFNLPKKVQGLLKYFSSPSATT